MWFKLALIVALIVCAHAVPLDERGADVCSSGIYKELNPLKNYPIAVAFCQAKFPPACVKDKYRAKRAALPTTRISSTKVTSTTASVKDATALIWAKATVQPYSTISTLCSCIQLHAPCPTSKTTTTGKLATTAQPSSTTKSTPTTTLTSGPGTTPSTTPSTPASAITTTSAPAPSSESTSAAPTNNSIESGSATSSPSSSPAETTPNETSEQLATQTPLPSSSSAETSSLSSNSAAPSTESITSSSITTASSTTTPSTTATTTSATATNTIPSCTPGLICSAGGYRYNIYCGEVISSGGNPNTPVRVADTDACTAVCDSDLTCEAWSFTYETSICTTYSPLGNDYTTRQDPSGVWALYRNGDCPI